MWQPSKNLTRIKNLTRVSCKSCTFLQEKAFWSCILQDIARILQGSCRNLTFKILYKFLAKSKNVQVLQDTLVFYSCKIFLLGNFMQVSSSLF